MSDNINQPYVKKFEDDKINCLNPITKDNPYLHKFRSVRGKSAKVKIPINNPLTGEFVGSIKPFGNNRANTCSVKRRNKGKISRNIYHN